MPLNAFFNSLKNLKYSDVKVMFDFFYFIRKNRKYSFLKALNRTLAILLRPLQYREKIENYIQNDFGYVINFDEHGSDNAFEFYSPTISKATGIQKILDYYHLDYNKSLLIAQLCS